MMKKINFNKINLLLKEWVNKTKFFKNSFT